MESWEEDKQEHKLIFQSYIVETAVHRLCFQERKSHSIACPGFCIPVHFQQGSTLTPEVAD